MVTFKLEMNVLMNLNRISCFLPNIWTYIKMIEPGGVVQSLAYDIMQDMECIYEDSGGQFLILRPNPHILRLWPHPPIPRSAKDTLV